MAKGTSARSGRPPDPTALRRERDGEQWVTLPAEGRKGAAPKWPLAGQSDREKELWAREWRRPQAVMWEHNGQEVEVAMYVRSLVAAEKREAPTNARTLVRQQQEALGLSIPGLLRNRWKIADSEPQHRGARQHVAAPASRERFKVASGTGA